MKKCNKCLIEKEISEFPKVGSTCKSCVSKYKKEYALKNKEKISKYKKEYALKNKEKISENSKKFYLENSEEIKNKVKNYYQKNKEKIQKYRYEYNKKNYDPNYHKKYRDNNIEQISKKRKKYYQKNKEKIKEKVRTYYSENKEYINFLKKQNRDKNKDFYNYRNRNYIKNKKEINPLFKLICAIRSLISQSFKGQFTKKSKKTIEILGCDFEIFKKYIESKFTKDMTWDNYGVYWQLDHITPISWATSEEEVYKLNHYTNFQPLYWKDNISKGNRISG